MKKSFTTCVSLLVFLGFATDASARNERFARTFARELMGGFAGELGGEAAKQVIERYRELTNRNPPRSATIDQIIEQALQEAPRQEIADICYINLGNGYYCRLRSYHLRGVDCVCTDYTGRSYLGFTD